VSPFLINCGQTINDVIHETGKNELQLAILPEDDQATATTNVQKKVELGCVSKIC